MRYLAFYLTALSILVSPALAKPWLIDKAHSQITFTGMQGSTAFNGNFKNFDVQIDLDEAHPESGKITATIDIASITAGSAERDSYLPQPDWFDTKKFPQAVFASSAITKTGKHAYEARGNLTIKGVSQPVSLPFTLLTDGDHSRAQGTVALTRTDYKVGTGDWAKEDYVKHKVDVSIDLSAKPQ